MAGFQSFNQSELSWGLLTASTVARQGLFANYNPFRARFHSIAASSSSSVTVAKLVAESLIAYGMMSSRPCSSAPQV
jgi:hypothetical protein